MKKIIYSLVLYCILKTCSATDIIIHKGTLNRDDVSSDTLIPIFTKKQRFWNNGEKITVFVKPLNSIEHATFASEWLGITVYKYKKILKRAIYSGKVGDVKVVLSDYAMLEAIMSTPYSIGYLSDGSLLYSIPNVKDNDDVVVVFYE